MNYKKLLIRQQTYNGSSYTDVGEVVDTQEAFNVVCQEFPFRSLPEIKDLPQRDWYDENGDDVFIPSGGPRYKGYDLEVKFLYVGSQADMNDELSRFVAFIYGRNTGGSPLLAIYDEYTKTGRRGVYVQSVDNDLFLYDERNVHVIAQFKVKFRVTDPLTDITLP